MHEHHKGHVHNHGFDKQEYGVMDELRKLLAMLDHWVEHGDSHIDAYKEWAGKASFAGEEEIAREIHLAVKSSETAKVHLKRAKSILAAKLVLKK